MTSKSSRSRDESFALLKGLFNIAVTPFDAAGALDPAALSENLERMLGFGYDGFLIGGTYGEFPTMTLNERAALFRTAAETVAGRAPLLLCSAAADLPTAEALTELAGELGGIPMVTPPFVSEVTDDQIVAFFRLLAKVSRSGLVIYNAPGVGITLSPGLIERLAEIPEIVGVKQGDLSPGVVDALLGRVGGRLRLFCASDLQMAGPVSLGFDGLSSTNAGALPELVLEAFRNFAGGAVGKAAAAQARWFGYREFARRAGQPQTVKAAMALRGWRGGRVRPPLRDLDEAQGAELAAIMDSLVTLPQDDVPASGAPLPAEAAITD